MAAQWIILVYPPNRYLARRHSSAMNTCFYTPLWSSNTFNGKFKGSREWDCATVHVTAGFNLSAFRNCYIKLIRQNKKRKGNHNYYRWKFLHATHWVRIANECIVYNMLPADLFGTHYSRIIESMLFSGMKHIIAKQNITGFKLFNVATVIPRLSVVFTDWLECQQYWFCHPLWGAA